jgi:hypothetical protein
MGAHDAPPSPAQVRLEGELTRDHAEALVLEIRRLARRYGLEVRGVTVTREGS